ncbi:hypothetical protein ABZ318_27350 [Streptomyces sp. NPDC006197]|uniref:hypothetical protein n=1 Tax=Streptomyces sp. NPDC006197 TaxID=3156685 RepID=UPI0033A728BA
MISEPEMVGGVEFDAPEVLTEAPPPPRGPRARRPWLWALGGAVLASAVWGGGLYAYEQKQQKEPGPDTGGYLSKVAPCPAAKLKALGGILGKRVQEGVGQETDDPSLYQTSCQITFGSVEAGYGVSVEYVLHRVTDPGPEFAARMRNYGFTTPIDGLGEVAFFEDHEGGGAELRVLDGQAEIGLSVNQQFSTDENGKPLGDVEPIDLSGIDVPMTQDLLAFMDALKK